MKHFTLWLCLASVVFFAGCSDNSSEQKTQTAPAASEFETGRFALQKMLPAARLWGRDAQPISLQSEVLKGNDGHDGKSGFWRSNFASVSGQKAKSFSWSGLSGPDAPARGIDHGSEQPYNPSNRSMQSFDLNFLKSDSDEAFKIAQAHGGKELLEKDPKQPVMYMLGWDPQSNSLRWRVIYGSNAFSGKLVVVVDATTGEFIHKE